MRLASFNARVETVSTKPFAALLAAGMSVREIAEEIGIAKSVVHRTQKIEREAKEAETGHDGGRRTGAMALASQGGGFRRRKL